MIRLWNDPTKAWTKAEAQRLTDEHNEAVAAYLDSVRVATALADGWAGGGGCINAGAEVFQQARAVVKRFKVAFADQEPGKPADTKTVLLKVAQFLENQALWYHTQTTDTHGINTALSVANQDVASAIRDALK